MKTLLTLLLTSSLSLFASPYWVQVSSIDSSRNVSTSFLSKIKQSGFSHNVIENDGRKRVCLGPFKSKKAAKKALPRIRCKIAYDAFVVGKYTKKKIDVLTSESKVEALKSLPVVETPKPCVCVYDVHMLHKAELDKAVNHYKNSSYYRFKK